ncbi:hypothetical protein A3B51_02940 [Candidatus Curtissbacteria bacterium RIFCSPLOWO2_01_FULL_41_18]|uniref:Bacterial Ig-like domain-containing protein n=2 Tax=Candidatus Curtissiibacteriota TaxID=1752717 RepID=A0A1F5FYA5_9BACT|nr:MAG: hypothetical protein A2696_01455 [Candidatus Curtissbacteria bacterium RIFCSPHIGHO2_01_FULL_41_13]OGE05522.1 MAG: hypothetical protein A3B51_02940 [Candidatus Curtissbacteria bacterium RIFCSPLOWO2_01_FULL_41_18]
MTQIVKRFKPIFFLISLFGSTFYLYVTTVFAGSGLISSIGGATFIQGAKQFWVTSQSPTFSGITTAQAQVNGTVGSQTLTATADSSGNWSWTPTTALSGDNQVSVTSNTQSASFILTIGSLPEEIASASASTLPPAGNMSPTIIFLGAGLVLLFMGSWGLYLNKS